MADMTSLKPSATFESLLKIGTANNQNLDATLRVVEDGTGVASALYLATDSVMINGTNRLYINDEGGEYISGDGTDLTITSGADILLAAGGNVGIGCTPSAANGGNSLFDLKYNGYLLWQTHGSDADERAWGFKNSYGTKGTFGLASSNADDNVLDTSVMSWSKEGNVGIGTTAFASGVKCLGLINGTAPGGACTNTAGLYTSGGDLFGFADDGNATALAAASSDERAKDNIAVIPNALSRLANVKGVTFNYVSFKDSTLPFKDKIPDSHEYTPYKNWGDDTRVGVIAQGVEVAYDGLNITNSVSEKSITEEDYDPELGKEQEVYGTSKQVDMETLIPLLIEAVKELSAEVEKLKA